jgi:hypothetical protein
VELSHTEATMDYLGDIPLQKKKAHKKKRIKRRGGNVAKKWHNHINTQRTQKARLLHYKYMR